jgi:hypothetical protein
METREMDHQLSCSYLPCKAKTVVYFNRSEDSYWCEPLDYCTEQFGRGGTYCSNPFSVSFQMQEVRSFETLLPTYKTTRCHNLDRSNMNVA